MHYERPRVYLQRDPRSGIRLDGCYPVLGALNDHIYRAVLTFLDRRRLGRYPGLAVLYLPRL